MSFVYIAFHPKQAPMAFQISQTLEKLGATTWIKPSSLQWDDALNAAALRNIILASAVLLILDDPDELDPPEYLRDIIEAKNQGKPFFIIKTEQEFTLLLPQIRQFLPRHQRLLPLPLADFVPTAAKRAPFHIYPGWFEFGLALVLIALILIIMLRLNL